MSRQPPDSARWPPALHSSLVASAAPCLSPGLAHWRDRVKTAISATKNLKSPAIQPFVGIAERYNCEMFALAHRRYRRPHPRLYWRGEKYYAVGTLSLWLHSHKGYVLMTKRSFPAPGATV